MMGKTKKITPTKISVEMPNVTQNPEVTSPLAIPATAARIKSARISVIMVPPMVKVTARLRAMP